MAALQKSLSQADGQLTVIAALPLPEGRRKAAEFTRALPSDSVLVQERNGEIEAFPEKRLPFYPAVQAVRAPPSAVFTRKPRQSSSGRRTMRRLCQSSKKIARSNDPGTRAAALLRMARICRKQGRWDKALGIYQQLSATGGQLEGVPAELVARQARMIVFEHQQQSEAARREATAILSGLRQRRWRLTRGAYEFHATEARRVLVKTKDDAGCALAAAVESLTDIWQDDKSPAGRRLLTVDGLPVAALWRRGSGSTAALILGPQWLEAQALGARRGHRSHGYGRT